jgi:S-adenosylmethionine decarboxylase
MRNLKEKGFEDAFGLHLTIDGYDCDYDSLNSVEKIYNFLDETPDLIKMTKIMPPYVFKYEGKIPEDWGISGFVLIAESHISIHTFPDKNYLSVDIFSCKRFNLLMATDVIRSFFGMKKFESKVFDRGLEFPRNVKPIVNHLSTERNNLKIQSS